MRYGRLAAVATLLFAGCVMKQEMLHHTALRELRPGMSPSQVDSVLDGRYVRRGLMAGALAGETELWQVLIGESYARYHRGSKGGWKRPGLDQDVANPFLYWIGFENGRLAWWGRTGDWGTASKEQALIKVKVLNIQTEAPAKEQD